MKTNNHFAAYSAAAMRISASFLLLLGILFAGCRENKPENPTDPAAPAGTVTITGEIKVGSQLTASSDGNLTGAFTWESAESATAPDSDWNLISGSTDTADKSVLTLTTAQKDKFVRAKRGDVKSTAVGPVEDSTPARTITIEGKTVVGETLKAKDSDTTASGDFVWASAASETAPDSEWKLISPGGTGTDKSEL
ncbi:MAG: hypothetical protein LBH00_10665, partial [Planctomycetaceae bacterium]|nr:hypothetical protein [Planctomycetaceae bacterium]